MNKEQVYADLLAKIAQDLKVLEDKPEETPESTLRALWLTAAGSPVSAQGAELGEIHELSGSELDDLKVLIDRRLGGEPLAHITGRQQFMGVELICGPRALIPRKETELLGNAAISHLRKLAQKKNSMKVIDVCTGAGNLAVSYAIHVPEASVYASDLSEDAVSLAKDNVDLHKLHDRLDFRVGDLFSCFDNAEFHGSVDLITCNPPYISSAKVGAMDDEISSYEPRLAFDGGPFGIKILQRLISESPKYLVPGGCLMFEIGLGQGDALVKRMEKLDSYKAIVPLYDENDDIRAIEAQV